MGVNNGIFDVKKIWDTFQFNRSHIFVTKFYSTDILAGLQSQNSKKTQPQLITINVINSTCAKNVIIYICGINRIVIAGNVTSYNSEPALMRKRHYSELSIIGISVCKRIKPLINGPMQFNTKSVFHRSYFNYLINTRIHKAHTIQNACLYYST